ncbi:MAG: F0F1 ATP synthase subunit A [Tenacibaculum sp.]
MKVKKSTCFLATIALILSTFSLSAKSDKNISQSEQINNPKKIKQYIKHHLADSHDFVLFSYTNKLGKRIHLGFPLPVVVWTSEGLKIFMSSEFHHNDNGKITVSKGNVKLIKYHSKIYELNSKNSELLFDNSNNPSNASKVLDFSITKSVVGMLLAGLLILLLFNSLARSYKKGPIPTGAGRVLEPLVLYVRDEIAKPNIGEKHYRKFIGFLLSVFFFIWTLNIMGLTPFGFNVTGQIAVTVCLALFTFFIVQFSANKDYWKHIFWMPNIPIIMKIILAPIEVLGVFTKPFSLLIRLFANITAGHFVLMSLIALMITLKNQFGAVVSTSISLLLSLFIAVIEILVAFLQAFIFTMLSSLFIGMAVKEHEHH